MAEGPNTPASHGTDKRSTTLLLIALFKLVKCTLLVIVGIGAIRLIHRDMAEAVEHWVHLLRVDPGNHFIHRIIAKLTVVTPKQLEALSIGTFFYAALLLTEGVGLLLRKYWAEYFTVITTALFVPLELFEIAKHVSVTRIVVLILNVAIVVYLIGRIRIHKRAESEADGREGVEASQEA